MSEYKPIPFFRSYSINREGKIINKFGKEIKSKGNKVGLKSDAGKVTTRNPEILRKEIWGKCAE